MGMNTEGRVCILRYLHESFCSFNDSKTLCSENSSSDSINMPFYSLVQFVQFISFRLLVKCFWVPTVLAFELVKFATRSNLKMLRESSLEHSFVQCMKNKEANLESFLVMLSAGSGENLKALVLKYYCTHVAAAMSLLIDLGLITAHIFPVPNSESAEDMDLLNSCQYSFVRKPTIALNPIESPQDCGMFWRHILVPQLKEHESFRNEGVVKSDQLIRSTDPMISFSIRQLSADDFLRSNYDSTRRKRTIADFSEMASRRIYNYEVSAHDTKKKIKYGSYHKKPKIKLNGDSHVSSLIDSAMVDQVWSLDEDAFLIELYLDGLLIQSAASLPKGIRQKMMSRYREEIRTSDSLASAQATGVLPSLVRFNAVTKEFSSSNSELSACTYPAQSLLETNYEYLQVEGGRLLSTGKSLLQSQKIMTSGNYRLELLLKNIRYFRAAISYLLATKCTGHNQCNIYGDGIAEDLLDVINDVLDPLRLKESRNLCADILDEAAMTRCLQLMTAPVRKYSGDEPPLYPDSISALTLFEEDVYSRVVWELCNARLLQQAPSATISDKELNLRLFEKTEFPPRSFKMHRCVSYRKLLASYIKIAGAENAKTVLGKRATFADGLVEPKAKHRKINGIEALSTYPIDLTSASISAAEALVLIQNISQGYFCGNLNVMSDKSDKDVFDKEINSAENGSCITTTFSLHPSQPYVGDLHFLKKASSPSFVTMGKALSNIEIEIDTKYIGFELDRVTYDELVVGRDDFFTHADSTQIDSNVSAEVINIIKSFKNRGQSMLALLNQVQSAYPSSELIHEQILVSIVLKHFSSGIIFLYQRSVNFLSELELRFIPELEEYGQKTIEYFETLLLEPKHMRQQFYENVYLIHSDYRKFYYSSSSIESRCPWINADGRRDQDRFGDLITCVVSCLSSNPGSPIEIIQSVLPFVTLLQTAVLVGILVSDGIVEFKEVQVLRNAPSDPFQNEMSTQGLGVRTITLYYLPCHKVPCW